LHLTGLGYKTKPCW